MAGLTLEEPVVCGRATLRVLVRQEATGRKLGGGLWFTALKEPVAVVIEIDGTRQVVALEQAPGRAGSRLGIDPPS